MPRRPALLCILDGWGWRPAADAARQKMAALFEAGTHEGFAA
jgi:hypothetical protein